MLPADPTSACCKQQCFGKYIAHRVETGDGQIRIHLGESLLHLLVNTRKVASGTNDPAGLKPNVREVDQLRRHLGRRHIDSRFRNDGSIRR